MKTRGRRSMEEMLIKNIGLAASITRPDPPDDLDEEESIEWRRIVNSMPAHHFIPANHHMLIELCQHIIERRRLVGLIRSYCVRKNTIDVQIYLDLVKQREAETKVISNLSRSCRLTHQSTFNPIAVKLHRQAGRQVQVGEDDETW